VVESQSIISQVGNGIYENYVPQNGVIKYTEKVGKRHHQEQITNFTISSNITISVNNTDNNTDCKPECYVNCQVHYPDATEQKFCLKNVCKCKIIEDTLTYLIDSQINAVAVTPQSKEIINAGIYLNNIY
jgi:hypothetical protein